MKKCCFVTNFEPTFLNIKTGFKKFKHITEDDEKKVTNEKVLLCHKF